VTETFAPSIGQIIEARMHRFLRLHYGENGFKLEPKGNPYGLVGKINRYLPANSLLLDTLPTATAGTEFQRDVCGR